ncbi:MAG: transposase [Phycisphaerales bacterium]|nr:transposase [Phycisphaerales bacterium]
MFMRSVVVHSGVLDDLVAALQTGVCDEAAALRLYALGSEAVKLALLAAARRIAEQAARIAELQTRPAGDPFATTPATPSGMIPVYLKANVRGKDAEATDRRRRKRPGGRHGHPGHRRPAPLRIDRRVEHRAACCPDCGGALQRCNRRRTRITEDLPENIPPQVTEHTIHRDYCPNCRKDVEPGVPDALPGATLGHRVVSFASWCHYGLGVTIDQLIDILQFHLQTRLSAGGLVACWQRLADVLAPWYEQIAREAKSSAHLHADETGWRVQGQTCWLWCFANGQVCYYMIDRCRGSPAAPEVLRRGLRGHPAARLLERVRIDRRGRSTVLPRAPAARTGESRRTTRRGAARHGRRLAHLRQNPAATDPRRHPSAQAAGLFAATLCHAHPRLTLPRCAGPECARPRRRRTTRRSRRPAAVQTPAPHRRSHLYLSGPPRHPL